MDKNEVLEKLKRTKVSIDARCFKEIAGIYALFLKKGSKLKEYSVPDNGLIYIGSTGNLAERVETHFKSDNAGLSTVRRTIGAIMKEDWCLKPIPRSPGLSKTNCENYKFTKPGERRITKWMKRNLKIGCYKIDRHVTDYKKVEKEMLIYLRPILNLRGCDSPYRKEIMQLRKKCSEEARRNRAV